MLCIKNGDDDKYKNGDDDEYKNGDDDDEYRQDNFNKSKQTFIRDPVLVYLMQLLKKVDHIKLEKIYISVLYLHLYLHLYFCMV